MEVSPTVPADDSVWAAGLGYCCDDCDDNPDLAVLAAAAGLFLGGVALAGWAALRIVVSATMRVKRRTT